MAPMVHGLEAEYFGKIKFTYLEADDPRTLDFQQSLGFYYQPEAYLLDGGGNVLMKWVGFTNDVEFRQAFAQYVQ
jgi:hypothetical protein